MVDDPTSRITELVTNWTSSGRQPVIELFEALYKDLQRLAQAYMRRERPDHTLQATALVHEAYLKIYQGKPFRWDNRQHFFCLMAQTMRRILVDHARTHHAHKRGGERRKISLDAALAISEERSSDFLALSEALERLSHLVPRQGQVVDLRYFIGLTVEQTAAILNLSPETVKSDWRFAKAWLQREIGRGG